MKFFVPHASDDDQAERVYDSIAKFNGARNSARRISALAWIHNGEAMTCEVGKPPPPYYRCGEEPVLAIFDCGKLYKICTPNRGGVRGEAILAGKDARSQATYFE